MRKLILKIELSAPEPPALRNTLNPGGLQDCR